MVYPTTNGMRSGHGLKFRFGNSIGYQINIKSIRFVQKQKKYKRVLGKISCIVTWIMVPLKIMVIWISLIILFYSFWKKILKASI